MQPQKHHPEGGKAPADCELSKVEGFRHENGADPASQLKDVFIETSRGQLLDRLNLVSSRAQRIKRWALNILVADQSQLRTRGHRVLVSYGGRTELDRREQIFPA